MNSLIVTIFILFFAPSLWALSTDRVYFPRAQSAEAKAARFNFLMDYFQTTGHFDFNGNAVDQTGQESFKRMQMAFVTEYFLSSNFEVFGGARIRNNQSVVDRSSGGTVRDQSIFGLESVNFGLKYYFESMGNLDYAFEFETRYMTFTNKPGNLSNPDDPLILGDDGVSFKVGPNIDYHFTNNLILGSYVFYHIPNREQSHEILYDLHLAWIAFNSVGFLGGVNGIFSLKTDGFSDDPWNKPYINKGATNLYNSVNREEITPYLGINIALKDRFRVELSGGQTVYGTSTDSGQFAKVNFVFSLPGKSLRSAKIEKFKEYESEANVIKVSPRGRFVKVDKGLASDFEKGMKVDFFDNDYLGGNALVATGVITEVSATTAIVKILELYGTTPIKEGLIARVY